MRQNEWKPTERGASKVEEFLTLSWPKVVDRTREVLRLKAWQGAVQRTGHARDSSGRRFHYYNADLAAKVCRLQARDFVNFGYPCWDGQHEDTFRIL